ncbi:MAG TPA: glycogen/starch synthase, partial [Gemmatimonadales bacterium]|nr:glycogen/starch synthase [Gemmatimonadales bacterium]
ATQAAQGIPVAVVMPLHRSVRSAAPALERVAGPFQVQVGPRVEEGRLFRIPTEPGKARLYCIEHPYFDRAGLYGESGMDYGDNLQRWAFFCRAALEMLPRITRTPCVLHCHDWHTALAPVYLRVYHQEQPFARAIRTVLTVHNAGFQGHFPADGMTDIGLPWELYTWQGLEWHGRLNLLQGGLKFADLVTTVSPTHAHELRTPVGGFGLHDVFLWLGDRFVGIVNGIDMAEWDPATDPHITATYSPEALAGKARCKAALQRSFGLPQRRRIPLFAMTARMTHQKGLELITGEYTLFMLEAQFIFLGTGESRYEAMLKMYEARWPDRISVHLGFSERLEHRLMAGTDIYLMPSLYEPCGLAQLRAERYGAVPLARRVGGLADTIQDGVTGFLFDQYSSEDLLRVARHVMDRYHDSKAWEQMMRSAMQQDWSWDRSAERYLELYQRALGQPPVA